MKDRGVNAVSSSGCLLAFLVVMYVFDLMNLILGFLLSPVGCSLSVRRGSLVKFLSLWGGLWKGLFGSLFIARLFIVSSYSMWLRQVMGIVIDFRKISLTNIVGFTTGKPPFCHSHTTCEISSLAFTWCLYVCIYQYFYDCHNLTSIANSTR